MNIIFSTGAFRRICNEHRLAVRRFGERQARLLRQRLAELRAATVLADLDPRRLPGPRCHELRGNMAGRFSVDLVHPYRLIFEPADQPIPRKPDGGLDWARITGVRILRVTDTHG